MSKLERNIQIARRMRETNDRDLVAKEFGISKSTVRAITSNLVREVNRCRRLKYSSPIEEDRWTAAIDLGLPKPGLGLTFLLDDEYDTHEQKTQSTYTGAGQASPHP